MKWKRIWISLWILTLLAIFVVTLVNHSPYFLLGGSSSVAPVMEELLHNYPNSAKKGDFSYVSSASAGALELKMAYLVLDDFQKNINFPILYFSINAWWIGDYL
ncbi:MAG: hypothetical protein ACRC8P_02125 [Spiroplasma sp.]